MTLSFVGGFGEAPSLVFRARLEIETQFWDRSDGDLGELGVTSRGWFEPVLVEFSGLGQLWESLQEWNRSRKSFSVDIGAENSSLVLSTSRPVGIQADHQQAFIVSYRSENERTKIEQVVVSDSTVVDQMVLDLEAFFGPGEDKPDALGE